MAGVNPINGALVIWWPVLALHQRNLMATSHGALRCVDSLASIVVDLSPTNEISWKDKFMGGSVSNSLEDIGDLDFDFEDGDIRRSNHNGIPAINFLDCIKNILIKGMELTVVVKLLGRNIGYGPLLNRITDLWKPTKSFHLMDIANGYYLIRFQNRVDYDAALTQAP
ncbi:hypothetical protein J1N35_001195 [Gossypium stocksii]|uniref:DUF4283 domain-containing protein n=1 Tax=Gossypium stocksii TaxID=47602 RepID=A0A9D3WII4_9ROSI|nr:hypothetical protein J1N35_001195 [Gossypium stocksii]